MGDNILDKNINKRKIIPKNYDQMLIFHVIFLVGILIGAGAFYLFFQPKDHHKNHHTKENTYVISHTAEKIVKADIAKWEFNFRLENKDFETARQGILEAQKNLIQFLKAQGFEEKDINLEQPTVNYPPSKSYYGRGTVILITKNTIKNYFFANKIIF